KRRIARQRALLRTPEKARCRSLHSKDRCRDELRLCTEFPSVYEITIDSLRRNKFGWRLATSALLRFYRFVLHRIIAFPSGQAVLVWASIGYGSLNKIPVWWWRRRRPLQRGRFPRIVVHLFAVLDAPEEINDERNLGETHDPRRPGDGVIPLKAGQSPNRVFV